MNDIHENGFVLLKNILTPNDLQFGLSSIHDDNKVDYTIVDEFVRNIFLSPSFSLHDPSLTPFALTTPQQPKRVGFLG
jgi:hypothetical protein